MENQKDNRRNNEPATCFEDLDTWKKAHEFVLRVYQMTNMFPKSEVYGLSSQMRRAAYSIPANIAEGFKKRGKADKVRYLNISQGSLEETKYYLILSRDLGYADASHVSQMQARINEVDMMLDSYMNRIIQDSRREKFRVFGFLAPLLLGFLTSCFLTSWLLNFLTS